MEEENVLITEEIIKVAEETENRAHRIKKEVTGGISLETEINLKLDLLLMTIRILNNRVIDLEKKLLKPTEPPQEQPDLSVLKARNRDKTSVGPEINGAAKTGDETFPEKGSGDIKQEPVDPEIFNVEREFLKPIEQPPKLSIFENIWAFL